MYDSQLVDFGATRVFLEHGIDNVGPWLVRMTKLYCIIGEGQVAVKYLLTSLLQNLCFGAVLRESVFCPIGFEMT